MEITGTGSAESRTPLGSAVLCYFVQSQRAYFPTCLPLYTRFEYFLNCLDFLCAASIPKMPKSNVKAASRRSCRDIDTILLSTRARRLVHMRIASARDVEARGFNGR